MQNQIKHTPQPYCEIEKFKSISSAVVQPIFRGGGEKFVLTEAARASQPHVTSLTHLTSAVFINVTLFGFIIIFILLLLQDTDDHAFFTSAAGVAIQ